jgi:hypothetical protein
LLGTDNHPLSPSLTAKADDAAVLEVKSGRHTASYRQHIRTDTSHSWGQTVRSRGRRPMQRRQWTSIDEGSVPSELRSYPANVRMGQSLVRRVRF